MRRGALRGAEPRPPRRQDERGRERGTTLLETLVAFAILALSLGAIYPALGDMHGRRAALQDRWVAAELARSLIAEQRAEGLRAGAFRTGRFAGRYAWELRVAAWQPPEVPIGAGLVAVTVEVTAPGAAAPLAQVAAVRQGPDAPGAGR